MRMTSPNGRERFFDMLLVCSHGIDECKVSDWCHLHQYRAPSESNRHTFQVKRRPCTLFGARPCMDSEIRDLGPMKYACSDDTVLVLCENKYHNAQCIQK